MSKQTSNGGAGFRTLTMIIMTAIVLGAGGAIWNHESRITRVETQVDIHLEAISDTLQSIEAKLEHSRTP